MSVIIAFAVPAFLLLIAVVVYFPSGVVGWLLWLSGALMAGAGLFLLIRALRAGTMTE